VVVCGDSAPALRTLFVGRKPGATIAGGISVHRRIRTDCCQQEHSNPSSVSGRTHRGVYGVGTFPRSGVRIVGVPGASEPGVSFGVAAAKALEDGELDGFWANAMGAENAVRGGVGKVVLDVRRGPPRRWRRLRKRACPQSCYGQRCPNAIVFTRGFA
jgi:hypothetical protein